MRVATPTHVARGRKTLQMHGFPIQTYGKTLKCNNFKADTIAAEKSVVIRTTDLLLPPTGAFTAQMLLLPPIVPSLYM